jgi:hypothetical protein
MERRTFVRSVAAAGATGVAGCINTGTDGETNPDDGNGGDEGGADANDDQDTDGDDTTDDNGKEGAPERLLVASGGSDAKGETYDASELAEFVYDKKDGYGVASTFEPKGGSVAGFEMLDGDIYAVVRGSGTVIKKLDEDLSPADSTEIEMIESMGADDEYLYVSAGHSLYVVDSSLEIAGETEILPERNKEKHLESTLVHDDDVYILDDVVRPLYLFRADVSDPSNPERAEVLRTFGVNETLGPQWLEPEHNLWLYLGRSATLSGTRHTVYYPPMKGVETEKTELSLFDDEVEVRKLPQGDTRVDSKINSKTVYSTVDGVDEDEDRGHRVETVAHPGGAAIVEDAEEGTTHLAEFVVEDGDEGVDLEPETHHEAEGAVHVSADEGYVYLVDDGEDATLTVFDDEYTELHRQGLKDAYEDLSGPVLEVASTE